MQKRFHDIWNGIEFSENKEEYIEYIPNGYPKEIEEVECLVELLLLTSKKDYIDNLPQVSEPVLKHTEIDGSNYLISKNGFQKLIPNKFSMLNTLSGKNELMQIPSDPNRIWFISEVIRDNER